MLFTIVYVFTLFFFLFFVGLAALLVFAPDLLTNDATRPDKFYVFTEVRPGEAKLVLVGGRVKKVLMNLDGHKVKGTGREDEAFEVVPLAPGEKSEIENLPLWEALLYKYTGKRYVGIFWGKLLTYRFPRLDQVTHKNGEVEIVEKNDISDHFVLTKQTHPFLVVDVETGNGENVKVSIRGTYTAEIRNIWKAAFVPQPRGQWLQLTLAALRTQSIDYARDHSFDTLLGDSTKTMSGRVNIGKELCKITDEVGDQKGVLELYGVAVSQVLVEDVDMTDPGAEASRIAEYSARRQAGVTEITAEATARQTKIHRKAEREAEVDFIREVSDEIRKQGAVGAYLTHLETRKKVSENAGTVIMNEGGQEISPILAGIYEEIKKGTPPAKPKPKA